jgi:hypothetical protein
MKIYIFWDITLCRPLKIKWSFGVTVVASRACVDAVYLRSLWFGPEDGGDMFLRNVDWLSTDYIIPEKSELFISYHMWRTSGARQLPPKSQIYDNGLANMCVSMATNGCSNRDVFSTRSVSRRYTREIAAYLLYKAWTERGLYILYILYFIVNVSNRT